MDHARNIADWLVADGPHLADMGEMLALLAEKLTQAGVPVARMATMVETLHPRFVGAMRVWEPGGDVRLRRATHDDPAIVAAPKKFTIDELQETGDWIDLKLDDPRVDNFDLLPRLRDEGHTHYMLMPVRFREGPLHGLSFSTKAAGGFTPDQQALIRSLEPAASAAMNILGTHVMWREVLKAYVGDVPGDLILRGAIRRADVRRVRAALFMSDMRGFTRLANTGTPEDTVAALDAYLDRVVPAVAQAGGEILKFIGDGVLAMVPIDGGRDESQACRAALAAARAAVAGASNIGVALHVGEAAFGNIGAGDRLDFTIIGRDVNLLARIEKICGETGEAIAMSARFAARCGEGTREIARFVPKGFDESETVFAPL
jgi:adenylate cyclase